jgi:hypothetical protein
VPTSGEQRDALITKAEFWRTLVGADEHAATTMAAAQTFEAISQMDLSQHQAGKLLIVVSQFVNTGDRAELDALLNEVANQTDST